MNGYVLTPAADDDLDEIWQYVCHSSGDTRADALEADLHAAMQRLGDSPNLGHMRHDLASDSLRVWTVHKILIIYRPDTQPIQIIRVLHGARDVQAIMTGHPGT